MERITDMINKSKSYSANLHLIHDDELLLLIREDEKSAHDELTERWATKLYKKAYKRIQNTTIAMALVNEVFFELWEQRDKLKIKKISDYLVGGLKDKLYILHEKDKLPEAFDEPLNHFAMAILKADAALSIEQIKSLIERWLGAQPDERVQVFDLKYKVKLTSKEISEKLDIPLKTVNEQLTNSRKSLNDYVQKFLVGNLD